MLDQTNSSTIVSPHQTISWLKQELRRLVRKRQQTYSIYQKLKQQIKITEEKLKRQTEHQLQQAQPNSYRAANLDRQQLQNRQMIYQNRTQTQSERRIKSMNIFQNPHKICLLHAKMLTLVCRNCQKSLCQVCSNNDCRDHILQLQQGLKIKCKKIWQKYSAIVDDQRQKLCLAEEYLNEKMLEKQQKAKRQFNYLLRIIQNKKKQITFYYNMHFSHQLLALKRETFLINSHVSQFFTDDFQGQIAFKDIDYLMHLQTFIDEGLRASKQNWEYNIQIRKLIFQKELDKTILSKIQADIKQIQYQFARLPIEKRQKTIKLKQVKTKQLKSAKSLSLSKFKCKKKN